MSWKDITTITLPIRAMGVTPSGEPMPLVALEDVIKVLKGLEIYGVRVTEKTAEGGG